MMQLPLFIRNIYDNLRIKHKLFLLVSLIMVISFSFTVTGLQYAFNVYDEQLYQKSSQVLFMSSNNIENEMKKIEELSFDITADVEIQNSLDLMRKRPLEYERFRIRTAIIDRLLDYAGSQKYIRSIHLFDVNGEEYTAGNRRIAIAPQIKQTITQETKQAMGANLWIRPDQREDSLIAAREVRMYRNLSFDHLGTLMIRIDVGKMVRNFSDVQDGEMIIMSGADLIYPNSSKFPLEQVHLTSAERKGYHIETVGGQKYFMAYIQSPYTNWTYFNAIPFNQIFERIVAIKYFVLFGFILMFTLVVILGVRFARGITSPIENLVDSIRHVQKGDFDKAEAQIHDSDAFKMDEVGLLQRNFNLMIQRINELITENYAKQLTIKETEFKALQAQINPHFLYNTLESINWLAKVNQQPQISKMVESLGFLLRNSISLKEPIITVEEELQIVLHYVTIQTYRFEERLDFHFDLPQEIRSCCIPKLTLQPLLENAIHYALEPMIDPCKIAIRAEQTPDGFVIMVEDNGPGMEASYLEKLQRGEVRTRGQGIGLKNIEDRIKLTFGESYGIRIESEPGKGTRVSVILPYEKGGNHVQGIAG